MLKSLHLQNFRGFRDHRVEFTSFNLLIGQNNAGKTTVIEALRIVALAQAKAPKAIFMMAPESIEGALTGAVFRLSLASIDFDFDTVHHQNEFDSIATITARLSNNCSIIIALGRDPAEVFCQLQDRGGKKVNSRDLASNPKFGRVLVMPPVGHVLEHETPISAAYLAKHSLGYRAHRHIRNQMYEDNLNYLRFKALVEESWSKLQLGEIELITEEGKSEYRLSVRDGPFAAELGRQGSGLQAWFQTLWFVVRASADAIVVLDEPDVYLHADLQRKLLKVLGGIHFRQVIVATHSVEMISDVAHDEIIVIKKRDRSSKPLTSSEDTQQAMSQIGTMQNVYLSKLAATGILLFLEGKDKSFLSEMAYKMGARAYDKLQEIPSFSIGGFNNWPRAALSAKTFYTASSGHIRSYLILDRDYKDDAQIGEVTKEAKLDNLDILCWRKKEIENYLLVPAGISRAISGAVRVDVAVDRIAALLAEIVTALAEDLEAQVAEAIRAKDRKLDIPTALKRARAVIQERRAAGLENVDMVSGKEVISRLSVASQTEFGTSLNAMAICRSLKESELNAELVLNIKLISGLR